MSKLLNKDKGFTLIEIVLVLAIAGLLLVIIFIAVQGANRARRDSQRKNDAARMLAAIESCVGNNNGVYANCTTQAQVITANYFSGNAPDGSAYTIGATAANNAFVINRTSCPGNTTTPTAAVRVGQEAGAAYCVQN